MLLPHYRTDEPDSPDAERPPDGDLIAGTLAGSEESFVRLMERYRPLLWRIACRMALDADDAWDICQEIVIRLWRVLPRFRQGAPFAPWLRVIAVREALRWLRRYRGGPRIIPIDQIDTENLALPAGNGARATLAAREDHDRIAAALTVLSTQQRTAVVLRFFEEMSLAEIAEVMECSEGSIKQHLFRAMDKLRQVLKRGDMKE